MRHISLLFLLFLGSLIFSGSVQAEAAPPEAVQLPAAQPPTAVQSAQRPQPQNKSSLTFESLEQMDELAYLGMPALALHLLTQEQLHQSPYTSEWYVFERKRITLLSALENWQAIIDGVDKVLREATPDKLITPQISQWFISQQIIARLQLGQPEKALAQLRLLLWNTNTVNAESSPIALWRRLVIRAYLLMHADDDAQKALLRYQQDYRKNYNDLNEDWRMLQARVMLRTHRPSEVISLLADSESAISKALRLVAAVRSRPAQASLYVEEAQVAMNNAKLTRAELWSYRYVVYEAALRSQDLSQTSIALQSVLELGNPHSALGEEFYVGGDDLWALYEKIGNAVGNQSNLLLGDDLAWYNKANTLKDSKPVEALGLFAVLAFKSHDKTRQELAHKGIIDLLAKEKNGLELINQLYLVGDKITSVDSLPIKVRYRLVDYALSKGYIEPAARLMQSLIKPPKGQDIFEWNMRKARVLILDGSYEQGELILRQAVAESEQLAAGQIDQFLQVIFDLQTVQRHQQAIEFMDALKEEWLNLDIKRELFFWKAESLYALEDYAGAAWLYLRSAMLADQTESALWAQSARFKAAGALVKAGLYDDAQTMYTELLRFIESDSRKTFIRQELQQIRLLRNAEKRKTKEI